MSKPLVTIAMPVYMAEATIKDAVKSVLEQTCPDFELLIVDDGSNDNTLDIIRAFSDERIKLLADGKHKGIAARLNQMISMAQGKFLARMDADDMMMPMRLEKQLAFFQKHPEADAVGCSAVVIDEQGRELGIRKEKNSNGESDFAKVKSLIHPSVMGHVYWFRKHLYNEKYSGCEDYELWLRVKNEATLLEMAEPLIFYREHLIYDVKRVWRERALGIKMIWCERALYGSAMRAVAQMLNNVGVMILVPIIHLLHLDGWVIRKRNR